MLPLDLDILNSRYRKHPVGEAATVHFFHNTRHSCIILTISLIILLEYYIIYAL